MPSPRRRRSQGSFSRHPGYVRVVGRGNCSHPASRDHRQRNSTPPHVDRTSVSRTGSYWCGICSVARASLAASRAFSPDRNSPDSFLAALRSALASARHMTRLVHSRQACAMPLLRTGTLHCCTPHCTTRVTVVRSLSKPHSRTTPCARPCSPGRARNVSFSYPSFKQAYPFVMRWRLNVNNI